MQQSYFNSTCTFYRFNRKHIVHSFSVFDLQDGICLAIVFLMFILFLYYYIYIYTLCFQSSFLYMYMYVRLFVCVNVRVAMKIIHKIISFCNFIIPILATVVIKCQMPKILIPKSILRIENL